MKYEVNFAEAAQMFNAVAKVEEAAKNFKEANETYNECSRNWDGECGTPQSEAMLKAFEERDKAEAAYKKAAKKAIEVLELNEEFYDEAEIIKNYKRGTYRADAFLYGISRQAVRTAGYIKY